MVREAGTGLSATKKPDFVADAELRETVGNSNDNHAAKVSEQDGLAQT